jgi:hypothetical protein
MSCDNLLRPAGVRPLLFRDDLGAVVEWLPPLLAHLALAAADNLARVAGNTFLRPLRVVKPEAVVPISDVKRFSRASISRRMPTASSNLFRDIIYFHIGIWAQLGNTILAWIAMIGPVDSPVDRSNWILSSRDTDQGAPTVAFTVSMVRANPFLPGR